MEYKSIVNNLNIFENDKIINTMPINTRFTVYGIYKIPNDKNHKELAYLNEEMTRYVISSYNDKQTIEKIKIVKKKKSTLKKGE